MASDMMPRFQYGSASQGVVPLYVRASDETDITCGFVIYLDAVIALLALPFNETDELLSILFRIGIRKGVTAVVPDLFVVQVFCQCRYVCFGPSPQFE